MKNLFITLILFSVIGTSSAQSGWTREKGSLFAQAMVSGFSSADYYTLDGNHFDSDNNFRTLVFGLYGEYGLFSRFTALANLPMLKLNSFTSTETIAGIGDLKLGIKYAVSKKLPVSISVEAEIPTGDGTNFAEAKELNELGIRERINLPFSDGEFNVWSTVAVSKATTSGKTYGSVFGSVNWRTQGFSHQLQAGIEVGQFLFDRMWLIGKLRIQDSFSDEFKTNVSFLYGEGTKYTAYEVSAMYHICDQWRLVAGYSNYADFISPLRNVYAGPAISLGVALEL